MDLLTFANGRATWYESDYSVSRDSIYASVYTSALSDRRVVGFGDFSGRAFAGWSTADRSPSIWGWFGGDIVNDECEYGSDECRYRSFGGR